MKVCFLSVEPIADQPRIRRQGDALHAAGYDVVAVGASGARSPAPEWRVRELDLPRLSGRARLVATAWQMSSILGRRVALRAYWGDPRRRAVLDAAAGESADVYVAREWRTLPIAVELSRRLGSAIALDSPELSSEETGASTAWRLFFRPMVVATESTHLPHVALVTAVSEGISAILHERYALTTQPTTVRNIPPYESHPLRPVGDHVEVLYLGGLLPDRGLEQVIESVDAWPDGWRLTLRGPGPDDFVARLRSLAAPAGERVVFAPVVPLTEMVAVAASSDVGIFAHQPNGPQADLALPNKLFEYMMAGLAVCVSGMPAMREIVEGCGCGVLIEEPYGVDEVTRAIRTLHDRDLDQFKRASLDAAKELNWERESQRYVDAFAAAFGSPR